MSKARRYGPLGAWLVAAVIVRAAIRAHSFHWTWIAAGLFVLLGVAWGIHDWRVRGASRSQAPEPTRPTSRTAPSRPTVIGFRREMLLFMGLFGAVFTLGCAGTAALVFYETGVSSGWVVVFGLFMVLGCGLFATWVVYAFRGLRGRSAMILDAEGLTDQSSPIPLGRVKWDEVEAIHWKWPRSPLATRPFVAIDRRDSRGPFSTAQRARRLTYAVFRSRGIDPAKLTVSDEELAHLFRVYSNGRFGIAQS